MRRIGIAGIVILVISLVISGATYLDVSSFQWTPGDRGFIYSVVLTFGFIAAIAAGLFGAIKDGEEFLIAGGTACLALAIMNKLFSNVLYSWSYLDATLLLAGALMIIDRFHVKRVKESKKIQVRTPEDLLGELDRLEVEAGVAEPGRAIDLEKDMYDVKRELWTEAEKSPSLVKKLRLRLYRSPVAQGIVKRLIDLDIKAIEPAIETGTAPKYPQLTDIGEYPLKKIQSTLNDLVTSGILVKDLYEKLVSCPHCHETSKVFMRNKCPKCGSYKSEMDNLMEHVKCGAVLKRNEFNSPSGLRCPKCDKDIEEEVELRQVGVVFECDSCKSIYSDPTQSFYCRNCEAEFEFKNCELVDTYSYLLNDDVRSEATKTLTVITMAEFIEKQGCEVDIPGYIKGKSGVTHEFTLTCRKEDKEAAIDLVTEKSKVDMATALSSYAKFMDLPKVMRLLIAMPSLEQRAKDFLTANQISYLEGKKTSKIVNEVKKFLEE